MSGPDPREELSGIARSLRRHVERQGRPAAELLARSGRAALARRGVGEPGARSRRPEGSPEALSAVAGPSAARLDAPPRPSAGPSGGSPPVVTNLFGEEVQIPSREAKTARRGVLDLEPPPRALNPAGWNERERIETDSLPLLEQVTREARVCEKCGLCETRTHAVPGTGSARSGIVFVGEAPGAEEDRQGLPFVGRAGELLTRIIQAMDDARLIPGVSLTRESVYICNVLKCRPPENRNPLPHEVESCSPYLERQLAALKPRVICCLGKFAAELLVGAKGTISGLRGKAYHYEGAKLIVTYHPAACLRNPNLKRPVWEDMQLLAREYMTD